jgi:hypothetical protein
MQANPDNLSPYWLMLFFALWVAWMSLIIYLGSILSGWHRLSKRFLTRSKFTGQMMSTRPFINVCMKNWADCSGILRIASDDHALYLSVVFLYRIGHPPLCIPWKEIQFSRTKFLWRRYVVLTLGEQERIPMRISERIASKLGLMERLPN